MYPSSDLPGPGFAPGLGPQFFPKSGPGPKKLHLSSNIDRSLILNSVKPYIRLPIYRITGAPALACNLPGPGFLLGQ